MASVLLNEMLSNAQTSLKSMAGHVDSIIAERRTIRQSAKSLEPTSTSSSKDSGSQLHDRQRRGAVKNLSTVQTSVERLTEASSGVLQVRYTVKKYPYIDGYAKS